jgi:predicted metal-dependent phosphoesterase TrpH
MHTNMLSTADLHLHTIHSDGHCTPAELVNHVLTKTDLRVIAVTDHDAIAGAYEAQRCATGSSLEVIIGEEISTREGHLLAYFIHELIPPGMSARDTIAAIHEQGGLAVAAHPYDWMVRSLGHYGMMRHAGGAEPYWAFDAIETMNASLRPRSANVRAAIDARTLGIPAVGGSDSHLLDTVAYGYTMFAGTSALQLRHAIITGQTQVAGRHWSMADLAIAGTRLIQKTVATFTMRSLGNVPS